MKKKMLRISGLFFSLIALAALLGFLYFNITYPKVGPAPDLKVEITPERVERGEYLANHVAMCMDCHSKRDWSLLSGPPTPGTVGMGGDVFDENFGFPGTIHVPNITPANLGGWTDGEIFRAITSGVSKGGHTLFPVMPYLDYRQMKEEDLLSIIAYIRTLPAVENTVPCSEINFPVNYLIRTLPQDATLPKEAPDPEKDIIAYGAYLVGISGCNHCHTPRKEGEEPTGEILQGGVSFNLPDGSTLRTPNLTPDEQTGIGIMTKDIFVKRFKMYADSSFQLPSVQPGSFQTTMPWKMYAGMKEEDLGAIYEYLQNLKPVHNPVVRWEPAPKKMASKE